MQQNRHFNTCTFNSKGYIVWRKVENVNCTLIKEHALNNFNCYNFVETFYMSQYMLSFMKYSTCTGKIYEFCYY